MTIKKYRLKKTTQKTRQLSLSKSTFSFSDSHGGLLRRRRKGRKFRPLSKTAPVHVVFKTDRNRLREKSFRGLRSHRLVHGLIRRYSQRFHIRIDQLSIQNDHIHLLVRSSHRFFFQAFFRVLAGQIAQRFQKEGLMRAVTDTSSFWKLRPFSRIIRGFRAYQIVRDYIQLNEKEALGVIRYGSRRLVGLSTGEWSILWTSFA